MTSIWDRSATASSNTSTPPAGFPEGQVPSLVDDQFRAEMAYVTEFVHSTVLGGDATAMTLSLTNAPASLTDGMEVHVRALHSNTTTTPTFQIGTLTTHTITKLGGSALAAGDIAGALHELTLRYNLANTRWELLNPAGLSSVADATNGGINVSTASGVATLNIKPSDLATKSSPTSADSVVIMDAAASNTAKTATISTLFTQPTRTVKTTGSGTYTTPTGATRINVRMVGGGGGGSGSSSSGGSGGNGGDTTFSTLTATKGTGGAFGASGGGGGGGATNGDVNISGGTGQNGSGTSVTAPGGNGAVGAFGGNGWGGISGGSGSAAKANTGGGGGGAAANGADGNSGSGGGAGGYCEKLITSPSATYSYAVGSGGSGGSAGSGAAGGAGGSGVIIIDEYYN